MQNQVASSQENSFQPQTKGDARDLLARLYREIGISAVAAALSVSAPRPAEPVVNINNSSTNTVEKDIAA